MPNFYAYYCSFPLGKETIYFALIPDFRDGSVWIPKSPYDNTQNIPTLDSSNPHWCVPIATFKRKTSRIWDVGAFRTWLNFSHVCLGTEIDVTSISPHLVLGFVSVSMRKRRLQQWWMSTWLSDSPCTLTGPLVAAYMSNNFVSFNNSEWQSYSISVI